MDCFSNIKTSNLINYFPDFIHQKEVLFVHQKISKLEITFVISSYTLDQKIILKAFDS